MTCYYRWVPTERGIDRGSHENYFKDWCLINPQATFLIFPLFSDSVILLLLLKVCKPDDFESHNSLKLSFRGNIQGLRFNFVDCECCFESNSPDILFYKRQTWRTQLILDILLGGVTFSNSKEFCCSYAWSCSLCEGGASFSVGLIPWKLWALLFIF